MMAEDLLAEARDVAARADRKLGTTRYVAAALLARQALEAALDDFWRTAAPGLETANGRAQLIALAYYTGADLAGDVAYAWTRLSRACHHDAYELPPPPAELSYLIHIVARFSAHVATS